MNKPFRIQLSRKAGWRLPANTVTVARPGKWGNPFPIGVPGPLGYKADDRAGAVALFGQMMSDPELRRVAEYPTDLSPLKGRNLACWCDLEGPCHADILLDLAN